MAPKRKNNDSAAGSNRPSPHRPQNLDLARQSQNDSNGRNTRRGGPNRSSGRTANSAKAPTTSSTPTPTLPANTESPTLPKPATPSLQKPSTQAPAPVVKPDTPANTAPAAPVWINTLPFYPEFVTKERIAQWKTSGRKFIHEKGVELLASGDNMDINPLFIEIMRAAFLERLDPVLAGDVIKEILKEDKAPRDYRSPSIFFIEVFSNLTEAGLPNPSKVFAFLEATGISPSDMRERLDISTLTQLGMVRQSFSQYGTRHSTNVLYKQTTYNILREDTEGYAKLIEGYYKAALSGPPTAELVSDAFQKVKSLIGAFNLDSGRALDITLDVFGDLLVARFRFFVRYLRASSFWPPSRTVEGIDRYDPGFSSLPWWSALSYPGDSSTTEEDKIRLQDLKQKRDVHFWDRVRRLGIRAFFELGGRQIASDFEIQQAEMSIDSQDLDRVWIAKTKTFPPEGNKMAAQLLGNKLRGYASGDREEGAQIPDNLIWLATLLVHIGFISLRDLYPHLYPLEGDLEKVKALLTKEKNERELKKRPGGGMNALLMAGALPDDTNSAPLRLREVERKPAAQADSQVPKEEAEKIPEEPRNQKLLLLESLLLIGAIPDALFIIGEHPWLLELCPSIMQYIHRILHYSVAKVYDSTKEASEINISEAQKDHVMSEPSAFPRNSLKAISSEPRRTKRWGKLDSFDASKEADYKFYWEDWSDNVPICQTVDDIFALCSTFLNLSGVRIGEDVELLTKLARIGITSINEDNSEANVERWVDLCKRILVPALSFTKSNPGAVNQVWDLVRNFPIAVRYGIYTEWFQGTTSKLPALKDQFTLAEAETKDILKRISKQNTKEMARSLAKVATSSPGIVFRATLNQIEAYGNLIPVVIECARYFTTMGYDILTWSILTALGGGSRSRMQSDGMLTNPWLRQLASFAGDVCKRYTVMNPSPILRYVANQLEHKKSEDLEILQQIISSMAGIRPENLFSMEQVQYLMGGKTFRDKVLQDLQDKRHDPKLPTKRLIRSLQESELVAPLLILLAHERESYIFRPSTENMPSKVLSKNADKLHHAFVQYLETLQTNLSIQDFSATIPAVDQLIKQYGIRPPIAFLISRDILRQRLEEHRQAVKAAKLNGKVDTPNDGDLEMADGNKTGQEAVPTAASAQADDLEAKNTEISNGDVTMKDVSASSATQTSVTPPLLRDPSMTSLIDKMRGTFEPNYEDTMSVAFYVWFWQLNTTDFYWPQKSYDMEQAKIKDRTDELKTERLPGTTKASRDAEIVKLNARNDVIIKEKTAQAMHITVVRRDLRKEKDTWFAHVSLSDSKTLCNNIIQELILPRALLSPFDALYACKWIFLIHALGTPGFRTIHIIDKMFNTNFLTSVITSCTAREVDNFGWFLNELLSTLATWHTKQKPIRGSNEKPKEPTDIYEEQAIGTKKDLSGFCTKVNDDMSPAIHLSWQDYRRLLFKWHGQLQTSLTQLLTAGEYMGVRNAVSVLKVVQAQYPATAYHYNKLKVNLESLVANDHRGDVRLVSDSCLSELKKREKLMVTSDSFRTLADNAKPSKSESAQPSNTEKKDLNPAVPEFKPTSTIDSKTAPSSSGEVEDGEIDDAKKAAIQALANSNAAKPDTSIPKSADVKDAPVEPKEKRPETKSSENTQSASTARQEVHKSRRAGDNSNSVPINRQNNGEASSRNGMRRPGSQLPPPPAQHALPRRPDGEIPKDQITHHSNERNKERPSYGNDSRGPEAPRDAPRGRIQDPAGHRSQNRTPEPSVARGNRDMLREPPRDAHPPRDPYPRDPYQRDPRETNLRDPRDAHVRDPRDAHVRDPRETHVRDLRDMHQRDPRDPYSPRDPHSSRENHAMRDNHPRDVPPPRETQASRESHVSRDGAIPRDPHASRDAREPRGPPPMRDTRQNIRAPDQVESSAPKDRGYDMSRLHPDGSRPQATSQRQRDPPPPPPREPPVNAERAAIIDHAPSGPRLDSRRGDLFQQASKPRAPLDPRDGRLSGQEFAGPPRLPASQDPNYGRLNPIPDATPSGPRSRPAQGARGGRVPPSPTTDRPAYSGPQGPELGGGGIHPSRLGNIPNDGPNSQASLPSPVGPPSGPRGGRQPAGNFNSGPAPSGGRRTLQNLNQHLQQAGGRPTAPQQQVPQPSRRQRSRSRSPRREREDHRVREELPPTDRDSRRNTRGATRDGRDDREQEPTSHRRDNRRGRETRNNGDMARAPLPPQQVPPPPRGMPPRNGEMDGRGPSRGSGANERRDDGRDGRDTRKRTRQAGAEDPHADNKRPRRGD
ncbi:hypothetical protein BT63DRAFT_458641 [Microthyrium microscopicum]|uniref:THO complex subunit 2 n=1 Tax=Microthyrium microscopicum TaxID=703497 RepID=A0A6A6U2Y2_9PEZI|nr:hypothetical protein BT63DRAFT_458641 [Microthyrium microscopicum]